MVPGHNNPHTHSVAAVAACTSGAAAAGWNNHTSAVAVAGLVLAEEAAPNNVACDATSGAAARVAGAESTEGEGVVPGLGDAGTHKAAADAHTDHMSA